MWFRNILILAFTLFLINEPVFSRHVQSQNDTTQVYKDIESYSKRSQFTKLIYAILFKPRGVKLRNKKLIQRSYKPFEGKVIRHIHIETLDPFGFTIADKIVASQNLFTKVGNKLHIKTKNLTIRNFMLIRQNQVFDSLLVKESERLVRLRTFVKDVSFYIKPADAKSDSVDIYIRILDNWSLIPKIIASTSINTIHFTEENFAGLGHEFQNNFTRDLTKGIYAYSTNYSIPNIRNTYISAALHYDVDGENTYRKSLTLERPFYSPLAKWAAGVTFMDSSSVFIPLVCKFTSQDYWAGHAQQLFKGNSMDERTTNLITTIRYLRVHYLISPPELYDPFHFFSSENFYLAGVGLSTRKYVQDNYVFKYGMTEDVPIGRVLSLTGGYQVKNSSGRFMAGLRYAVGNYLPWGYLSYSLDYETFFRNSKAEEGLFKADIEYFTDLFKIGKWRFRQFVKPRIEIGIDRFPYDSLTLNEGYGINGFKKTGLSGNSRLLVSLQTQAYSPWNVIGFRFGPFFSYQLGMLGNARTGFKDKRIYSQIVIGVLIKNENLILNTFQISVSFYPIIPGYGKNTFKTDAFQTTDLGFSDFSIGKPSPTTFQ
jgi:hypothetical protein